MARSERPKAQRAPAWGRGNRPAAQAPPSAPRPLPWRVWARSWAGWAWAGAEGERNRSIAGQPQRDARPALADPSAGRRPAQAQRKGPRRAQRRAPAVSLVCDGQRKRAQAARAALSASNSDGWPSRSGRPRARQPRRRQHQLQRRGFRRQEPSSRPPRLQRRRP